jgi:hypothetical protein
MTLVEKASAASRECSPERAEARGFSRRGQLYPANPHPREDARPLPGGRGEEPDQREERKRRARTDPPTNLDDAPLQRASSSRCLGWGCSLARHPINHSSVPVELVCTLTLPQTRRGVHGDQGAPVLARRRHDRAVATFTLQLSKSCGNPSRLKLNRRVRRKSELHTQPRRRLSRRLRAHRVRAKARQRK